MAASAEVAEGADMAAREGRERLEEGEGGREDASSPTFQTPALSDSLAERIRTMSYRADITMIIKHETDSTSRQAKGALPRNFGRKR